MFTGKGIRHNLRPVLGALASTLGTGVLLVALLLPETALGSVLDYTRFTSIRGSTRLSYQKVWGNSDSAESFAQLYSLEATGFYIDPRLAMFSVGADLKYDINKGTHDGDSSAESFEDGNEWLTGAHLRVSMLNNINRDRGIKLWRYLPSPVVFGYRYVVSNEYKQGTYNFSFVVTRPGYIRFFGPKGIIYYEEGKGKVTLDANRYRKKYNDETLNYNRNGDGNWNRNGNGNWNRNGNGNWNRNGNGNWNDNSGGGNWNRDGNAGSDWNASSNARFRAQALPKQPVGFRFPRIFYDLYGTSTDYKDSSLLSSEILISNLRVITSTKSRDGQGRLIYGSRYELSHKYTDINQQGSTSKIRVEAENEWRRLYFSNWYEKENNDEEETTHAQSRLYWDDSIGKYLGYNIGAGANYRDKDGNSTTSYYLNGNIGSSVSKEVRLSPKLTSISRADGKLTLSANQSANDETDTTKGWEINASEQLNSTHIDWFPIRAYLTTGYTSEGVPLDFSLGGISRGLRKATIKANYSYSTFFNSDDNSDDSNSVAQRVDAEARYQIRYNLKGYFKVERDWEETEAEDEDDSGRTGWSAGMDWRPTYRSSVNTSTNHYINDNGSEKHEIESSYKQGISRGSNLTASLTWNWQEEFSEKEEHFLLAYSWRYRQLRLRGEYARTESSDGKVNHRVYMAASRSFGRRLRI